MNARLQLQALFEDFRPDPHSPLDLVVQQALFLARKLQHRASQLQTPAERRQQAELDRMLQTPEDKATLTQLTDQAFRPHSAKRAADQFIHILEVQGIPQFFNPLDRMLLKGLRAFGDVAPEMAMPMVRSHMQKETSNVILPAETTALREHLTHRRSEGLRMNVNYLGEAILGEAESAHRLQRYLEALLLPEIEVVSVKISTLYSQISSLGQDYAIAVLADRLETLYRTAARHRFVRSDGSAVAKMVYLDMEEYRDMALTAEAFMRVLDRPGMEQARAGIVLQAYIPDSFLTQQQLNAWARGRVARGGAPITLRVVKGANMEMERVEASLRGWPQAPYLSKRATDANYKRMLQEGMRAENSIAVRLGVASHNLFELAYGVALALSHDTLDRVQFEMLEGMANHQRRAMLELTGNLLLYAPACSQEQFISAIGYLIRRLDENTGPENFLRHAFKIEVDSPEWKNLENAFLESYALIPTLSAQPRRSQDRTSAPEEIDVADSNRPFKNEPDTDFSLPHNVAWAREILRHWQPKHSDRATQIPCVVDGQELFKTDAARECHDPSRPGVIIARAMLADRAAIERALVCATEDPQGWRSMNPRNRFAYLGRVAQHLRKHRGDLIGAALAHGGKTVAESDPEVSEAIDFVEFYRRSALELQELPSVVARPKGVVVVVSPWNFPIAIPCGGIAAALAAGNTVILKPASDAILPAWELCQCFWRAGVSRQTLQFAPCSGATAGKVLVCDPRVHAVILTGGTSTALSMLKESPSMTLYAETGGKNATIVTALADRDQAIKHVLHSAFSHSGQKCSATSLLLLEAEIYDDPQFKAALCDAVCSLHVGSAWELHSKLGPLIKPPTGDLEEALKTLDVRESWAVMPRTLHQNPALWTPGVKWGVQPASKSHLVEFFGPVLGVMRFETLSQAIDLVNQTGYGLTSGLESLDPREQQHWSEDVRAGNLYINRPTTGAMVLRQPFGGVGLSSVGPGIKAGGPHYVCLLMDFEDRHAQADAKSSATPPAPNNPRLTEVIEILSDRITMTERAHLESASSSFTHAWDQEFSRSHDPVRLIGQDNLRRYHPVPQLVVRIMPQDSTFEIVARWMAAETVRAGATYSMHPDCSEAQQSVVEACAKAWKAEPRWCRETDEAVVESIRAGQIGRLRFGGRHRVPDSLLRAAATVGLCIITVPVVAEGRIELLWSLEEQSLSVDYHRYGNLGARSQEARTSID